MLLCLSIIGCSKRIAPNEVGVVVNNIYLPTKWFPFPMKWHKGVKDEILTRGQIEYYLPYLQNIYVFDVSSQTVDLGKTIKISKTREIKGLRLKSKEGNDIYISISVRFKLLEDRVPYIAQNIGKEEIYRDKIIIPVVRSLARTILGKLTSKEISVPEKRDECVKELVYKVDEKLKSMGIKIQRINIPKPYYNEKYEAKINEKERLNQESERILSKQEAIDREVKRRIVEAESIRDEKIERAKGHLEATIKKADSIFYKKQKEAEGITVSLTNLGKGLASVNRSLAEVAGSTLVSYEVAKKLQGKKILFIPTGGKGNINVLDMNELLNRYLAKEVLTKLKSKSDQGELKKVEEEKNQKEIKLQVNEKSEISADK